MEFIKWRRSGWLWCLEREIEEFEIWKLESVFNIYGLGSWNVTRETCCGLRPCIEMVLGKSKTMKKFKFLTLIREKVSLYESDLSLILLQPWEPNGLGLSNGPVTNWSANCYSTATTFWLVDIQTNAFDWLDSKWML
jgi:hypothetical protein